MTAFAVAQDRDANRVVINNNQSFRLRAPWTFATLTTGAQTAHTVFTVTGSVLVQVFAECSVDVTGTGTAELGVTGNTAALLAQTTGTAIDAGEVWTTSTPATGTAALPGAFIITNGLDILLTIGTSTLTAGTVTFTCLWRPLSDDGDITVTTPA